MSRIKWNAFANLAGTAWSTVLAIALVPLYLRHLGIEAYALVGIFTVLQTSLILFDLGLGLTVTRGMARLSVQENATARQRDLLRTVEVVYLAIAVLIGIGLTLAAGPIARDWIRPSALPVETVVTAVRWMGLANALFFAATLYRAALAGLDRQVLMNGIMASYGTVRAFGALAVLILLAPTIVVFLRWQALVALGLGIAYAWFAWRSIRAPDPPRFRPELLRQEWRYAAKVSTSLILNIVITHIDKVVLSAALPLATFGYYTLASTLAGAPWLITLPMNTAVFPRFTQLIESRDEEQLSALYHTTAQTMAVLVLPGTALVVAFSRTILQLWTRNAQAAANASFLASLLICGTALTGLASLAGYMATAGGRPQVMTKTNIAAAIVILPAMVLIAPRYGAVGAALVWIGVSAFHLFGAVPMAHRHFLRGELRRWYFDDTLVPMLAIAAIVFPARLLFPAHAAPLVHLAWLALIFVVATLAAVAVAPRVRMTVARLVRR